MSRTDRPDARHWVILLFLLLIRLPFILIHHVQEDAYITFRTARHLAEQGDFSFNLHQHLPATTSLLYPFIVAGIDLLLHRHMILGVQLLGTLCVIAASGLAARSLASSTQHWEIMWLLLACWPVSLVVSYTGMETPLLLLALGMTMYGIGARHPLSFAAGVFLLPLIRPDAVGYGLVFCAAMILIDRRDGLRGFFALATGIGVLLLGNRASTREFLPTTMRAKELAYHPSHAAVEILRRLEDIFFHQSYLLPVSSSYLTKLSPVLLLVTLSAFVIAVRGAQSQRERVLCVTLGLLSILIPSAYAAGGVIFDWYLFPANWLAISIVIAVGVRLLGRLQRHPLYRKAAWAVVALVWLALAGIQWTRSLAASTQDYHYRADIGRYLGEISHGNGTLLLEPAGYIPYFSGLRTDDEVGLVSNRVTAYMLRDTNHADGAWWMQYVEAEKPDYIVQHGSFGHFETQEGYTLTPEEQQWFIQHYQLLRQEHYEPWRYHPSPLLRSILALGPMPDYLVFRKRDVAR